MAITATRRSSAVGRGSRELQFVSFALGDQDFGVDIADIHGIYHGLPIIPNPDTPQFLEGEVLLADQRVPIVNLRRFAGMSDLPEQASSRWILIVNDTSGPVGLVVDRVIEVLKLQPSSLEPPSEATISLVGDYIVAVANHNGRNLYLPDLSRLLHDAVH
jgi:purine-binding chemotaxis protein CheW